MSLLHNQLPCQTPTPDYEGETKFLLFGQLGIIHHLPQGRCLRWRVAHKLYMQGHCTYLPNKAPCYLFLLDYAELSNLNQVPP